MDYISYVFWIFLGIALLFYYAVCKEQRWKVLLVFSLLFYMAAGIRFLPYLLASTASVWIGAILVYRRRKAGKKAGLLLTGFLFLNLGALFWLKWGGIGYSVLNRLFSLDLAWRVILPLGVSFFIFQNTSYLIDVYLKKTEPEKNFWRFCLFASYFPYISSGPINRFGQLAPQLFEPAEASADRFYRGGLRILWGLLKKLVLADRAAIYVNEVFGEYYMYRGLFLVLAVILFTLQLYMDFSGCMDIAIGISQLFGIDLPENFRAPFSAGSTAEFWRRWHVTLTSWFRDYIYIPLGGSRKGRLRRSANILIVFLICGVWHGAGITFLIWGMLNGLYQVVGYLTFDFRQRVCRRLGCVPGSFGDRMRKGIITFFLGEIAWLFFRAEGWREALYMLKRSVTGWNPWILTDGSLFQAGLSGFDFVILAVGALLVGWVSREGEKEDLHQKFIKQSAVFQYLMIVAGVVILFVYGIYGPGFDSSGFIYYNF